MIMSFCCDFSKESFKWAGLADFVIRLDLDLKQRGWDKEPVIIPRQLNLLYFDDG